MRVGCCGRVADYHTSTDDLNAEGNVDGGGTGDTITLTTGVSGGVESGAFVGPAGPEVTVPSGDPYDLDAGIQVGVYAAADPLPDGVVVEVWAQLWLTGAAARPVGHFQRVVSGHRYDSLAVAGVSSSCSAR